ncbi:MAG: alpha/beta fold hydrolase [Marinobacter sp.]|nr:alpha/beta fold hydrolase [Marinobacter sp.]
MPALALTPIGKLLAVAALILGILLKPGLGHATENNSSFTQTLSFLAAFFNQPYFPQSDAFTVERALRLPTHDGIKLSGHLFLPRANEESTAPVVIFINSWALNEYQYLTSASRLATQGYAVLSYSARGWGSSEGVIGNAGADDIADVSAVIDWLERRADIDTTRLALAGISYGAGISLLAAAHDARVKAVVAMSGWANLADALYGQRTPRLFWGQLLTRSADWRGKPDPAIHHYWNNLLAHKNIEDTLEWALDRSPVSYLEQLNEHQPAILMFNNWGDNLFPPENMLSLFNGLQGPKLISLQAGAHGSAEAQALVYDASHPIWTTVLAWLDQHLAATPDDTQAHPVRTGVQLKPLGGEHYEYYPDWPPAPHHSQLWHLHPAGRINSGTLRDYAYAGPEHTTSIRAWRKSPTSTGLPVVSQVLEQFDLLATAPVAWMLGDHTARYISDQLPSSLAIRGQPQLRLTVTPGGEQLQLVAYLYDIHWSGIGKLITHAPYTAPAVTPGEVLEIQLALHAIAYDLPTGNRLALVIDSQDPLYPQVPRLGFSLDVTLSTGQPGVLIVPTR